MLNLTSYMDETGHSEDPALEYVGMAGFLAPYGVWEVFEERWLNAMSNAGFTEPFHMKEFAHSTGQFSRWRDSNYRVERELFLGRLIEIILETKAMPIGAIVSIYDFRTLTPRQQRKYMNDPYYTAFQVCTGFSSVKAMFAEPDEPEEKAAMVYGYQDEFGTAGGRAEKLWHIMKRVSKFRDRMGSYASASPKDICQLQAADIFAYELGREFENQIKRPENSMRWPLRQILKMVERPLPTIFFYDRTKLLHQIGELSAAELPSINPMTEWLYTRGGLEFTSRDLALLNIVSSIPYPPQDMQLSEMPEYSRQEIEKLLGKR
jgi:hypothetical protein